MSDEQEWFYTDAAGAEHGPVSADELKQLATNGTIRDTTDVWTEGLEEWLPASQVEGLIPASDAKPNQPEHQPKINLGPGSGIQLGPSISPKPMGDASLQTSANPYARINQPKKSKAGWVVFGVIMAIAVGVGIYFATSTPSEPKLEEIPGYVEYSKANNLIKHKKDATILGNGSDALEISKTIAKEIKAHTNPDIEDSFPGLLAKDGEIRTYTMTKTEGKQKTVVVIVQVLKMKLLNNKAQLAMSEAAWQYTQMALAQSSYNDPATRLAVALRDTDKYFKVMIGHPVSAETTTKATSGITKSHEGEGLEARLYPFFAQADSDQ
ncbi:MAG: DUF4339 domain-containing protein [Verrucomicrobiae bacterium]|nr:DUF4339 domain-containing protein [Verrucomicrobiae bacterium]NNJ86289.1 DUF4339 domain-containing protein [Akkermansiaceae bacterium]